ncbi:hypothetical protein BLSTO_04852 [Blastocystis sp. subtype 1]
MERNSLMQIAKFLRYNSPSKRQIRRMVGRPKAPNAKELAAQAAAREPLLYTKKEDAPFVVTRTTLGKNLPVYSEYRNNGSRRLTIVRRIEGDITVSSASLPYTQKMSQEIKKVCPESDVEVHAGSIQVEGNRSQEIRKWLSDMGF